MFLMEMYDQKAKDTTLWHLAEPVTASTGPATLHQKSAHFLKRKSIRQNRLHAQANWVTGLGFEPGAGFCPTNTL